jgi:hypothetical protein
LPHGKACGKAQKLRSRQSEEGNGEGALVTHDASLTRKLALIFPLAVLLLFFFARDINNGVEPVLQGIVLFLQGIVLFLQRLVLTFKLVNPSFSLSIILLSVLAGTAGRWARAEVVGRSGIGTLFSKTEPSREWVQVVSGSRPDNATFSIPVTIY